MILQGSFLAGLALAALLAGCGGEAQRDETVVRLDLSGCFVPEGESRAGCGQSLKDRFRDQGGDIPACLAVRGSSASVAIPLLIDPDSGEIRFAGEGTSELPLGSDSDSISFKMFILRTPTMSHCDAETFQADTVCGALTPSCLMATVQVVAVVKAGEPLAVRFGGEGEEPCEFECNDPCAPGDANCVSVCAVPGEEEAEACDGKDNDCDGAVDEGCDVDLDGYCAPGLTVAGELGPCPDQPRDCDDEEASLNPGNDEVCNGVDDDCDGAIDESDDLQGAAACPLATGVCVGASQRCVAGVLAECGRGDYGAGYDGEGEQRCADGLDNDCDGNADGADSDCSCEAPGDSRPCGVAFGTCTEGTQVCEESGGFLRWGACDGLAPVAEACDGFDEDCDGVIDDGVTPTDQACPDAGVCAGFPTVCEGGRWVCRGPLGHELVERTCDGRDNDCDGETDEDLTPPATRQVCPVEGVCAQGAAVPQCDPSRRRWVCQFPPVGHEEEEGICDGLDNDCDGLADEGCPCGPGQGVECGSDVGECVAGTQACAGGEYGPCDGRVAPVEEVCDGLDNDCDGSTDEGLEPPAEELRPSVGVCRGELTVCSAEGWTSAAEAYEQVELTCDGLDNDCDGEVDEVDDLDVPVERACPGMGVCDGLENICVEGTWTCVFPDTFEPDERTCDALDNDCDGSVDEGPLAQPDPPVCPEPEGVCAEALTVCSDGTWVCELDGIGHEPGGEVTCDALDNDCDGGVDLGGDGEALSVVCYEGADGTLDVGECVAGAHICRNGAFDRGECEGQVTPAEEVCNGLDDDCDGFVDSAGDGGRVTRVCYRGDDATRGAGECADGRETCVEGDWIGDCVGELLPSEEVCDGLDNDCDDEVDDVAPLSCGIGVCNNEVPGCLDGEVNVCEPLDAVGEEVCNGLDDSCDGVIDNLPQLACGEGVCRNQVAACVDGADNPCEPLEAAVDEVCDGVDNDCDGFADNIFETEDPVVAPCYDGDEGTRDVGACTGGVATCDGGQLGECAGQVLPVEEICDGLDDDCDGELDESPLTAALATAAHHAIMPGGHPFGRGDFTVEAWVVRDADGSGTIIHQPGNLRLWIDGARDHVAVVTVAEEGVEAGSVVGATPLSPGDWHHLAAERQGRALRLYLDGSLDASVAMDSNPRLLPAEASALFVGALEDAPGGPFSARLDGRIEELRISRGAVYRGRGFAPVAVLNGDDRTPDLWHCDEGAGAAAANAVEGGASLLVNADGWSAEGLPRRGLFYADVDGDEAGDAADAVLACAAPPGHVALGGDCNDDDGDVGVAVDEIAGNQADDDCDGRTDEGTKAVALDGDRDNLTVLGALDLRVGDGDQTWDAWIRLDQHSQGEAAPIMSNRSSLGPGFTFGVGGLSAARATPGRLFLETQDDDATEIVSSTEDFPIGRWVHVAATWAGAGPAHAVELFQDGVAVGSGTLSPAQTPLGSGTLYIGKDRETLEVLGGELDDLRISDTIRWADDFDPTLCPASDEATTALWDFEGEGFEVSDRSGGGLDARLNGTAVRVASACDEKGPPRLDCESRHPLAEEVCGDARASCAVRKEAPGTCDAVCAAAGDACVSAKAAVANSCRLGAELACDEADRDAVCVCGRP